MKARWIGWGLCWVVAGIVSAAGAGRAAAETLVLEPVPGRKVDAATMRRVLDVLQARARSYGPGGPQVKLEGQRRIVVSGGSGDPAALARVMTRVGNLQFRHLVDVQGGGASKGRYRLQMKPGGGTVQFIDAKTGRPVPESAVLKNAPVILTGNHLKRNSYVDTSGSPQIHFELTDAGKSRFSRFTAGHTGAALAIVLDGKILSAPTVEEPIAGGKGVISGGFRSQSEASDLARALNSGALPVPLRVVRRGG